MADGQYYNQNSGTMTKSTGLSIAKVFSYMFFGLLITTAIAIGLGILFQRVLLANASTDLEARIQETGALILLIALIVAFIGIIVLSIVVPIVAIRNRHSVLVPAIIYCVLMGVVLSTLVIFIDWFVLGLTFGITAGIFGLMALIALLSKSRLNGLAIAAIGLFVGAGILALVMWILMIAGVEITTLYWAISLITFAAVMLITIWDMARIKAIAERGEMNPNVSLYCAYVLYNDFIIIFLRLLRFVLLATSRK